MRCSMRTFVLLLACVVCFLSHDVAGDACYQPRRNIGDEAGLAADICSINEALDQSPPDYVTALAFYEMGEAARDVTLINITTGVAISGDYAQASIDLFGDEDWMHDLIMAAFNGEGDEFNTDTKRVQVIKKLLQSAVLGHRMFSNMETSAAAAEDGNRDEAIEYLERAMANFFGTDSECAIFGNGQSRGIEFDTMRDGVSSANYDIVEAFADGALAIEADPIDTESLENAYEEIRLNFIVIYLQAAIKYATRIVDDNGAEKALGEGFGYYASIAGQASAIHDEDHLIIIDAFDLTVDPNPETSALVFDAVDHLLEDFGISNDNFGEYDEEHDDLYEAPEDIECEAVNPFVESVVDFADGDR